MYNELKKDGIYLEYIRKSRADLELERLKKYDSLKQHEKLLKQREREFGIKILKTFKEVVSGESIDDRPEMQKLLREVETGKVDGVFVIEVERLSRGDSKDQGVVTQTFKYSNTKIITLNKIYDPNREEDEEYFEFGLFMSRREYKTINRRMQRGRLANVLEGKYCASEPPFGYKKSHIKNGKGFTLEIVEDEANIVKELFKKRANNIGFNNICNWLNLTEFKPKRSDTWTPATIQSMLSNPIYLGKIRWNYSKQKRILNNGEITKKRCKGNSEDIILVEGLHPAIIEENLFNIVNSIKSKNPSTKHNLDTQNPLAGLVKCADCGRILQKKINSQNKKENIQLIRKYPINKEKLRLTLRANKGDLSLNQISRELKVSRNVIEHWFANTNDRFTIPYKEKWLDLKHLLNIKTDEFDKAIMEFEEIKKIYNDELSCPKAHCNNIGSPLNLVEKQVIEELKHFYSQCQTKILLNYDCNGKDEYNSNYLLLQKELEKNKKQLDKAYELVEQGIYTSIEFSERTKVIKDRIKNIEKQMSKSEIFQKQEKLKNLLPKINDILNNYYNVETPEKRNLLLKSVISHIDYRKEKGGRGYENNFSITIHPKI